MDPEDVRELLSPYYARLRAELEHFGGTVEKFIGDAVMALFGAPRAHEDDPERAVRAAFAIRDWVREEERLQVRIAVNTGEALVTLDARAAEGEGMAAGDVVNTTARLQTAAPVNGILVGESTYRATRHAIEYAEAPPVEAKGKDEPIAVWEALQRAGELRRRRAAGGAHGARRPRARARTSSATRSAASARGALAAARHARRRARDRQVAAALRALADRRRRARADLLAAGALAAVRRGRQLLGARGDGEGAGGHPRDGRRRGGRGEAGARMVADVLPARRTPTGCAGISAARRAGRRLARRRPARRGVLRLEAVLRGARGAAAARARVRGPALGRRRPARLRRPPRRLGGRRADPRRRHRAARSCSSAGRAGAEARRTRPRSRSRRSRTTTRRG